MTTKQTIEVEGLPEGWKAIAYRGPNIGDHVFLNGGVSEWGRGNRDTELLIVEKIQPRRIVLEEITDNSQDIYKDYFIKYKWWREVNETDISLTNEDPKLSLSVDECRGLFEGHQPTIDKVKEFIKVK